MFKLLPKWLGIANIFPFCQTMFKPTLYEEILVLYVWACFLECQKEGPSYAKGHRLEYRYIARL